MNGQLLLPVAGLIAVFLIGAAILGMDARQKRLQRRVAAISEVGWRDVIDDGRGRSIRLGRRHDSRMRDYARMALGIPASAPHAHVFPIWLVLIIGIVAGIGAIRLARIYLQFPLAVPVGIAVAIMVPRGLFSWELDRYRQKLVRQLPDVIDMVVGAVRAGLPIAEAFRAVARETQSPTREEFTEAVNEISLGTPTEDALMGIQRRTGVAEYAIFSVTLAIQARTGGRLAETIQNLAETIRQRVAIAARAQALAAEAKLSARVLTALPGISAIIMSLLQPGFLNPLLYTPQGNRLLIIAVVLLILGTLAMRRMIRGVTRE